MGIWEEQIEEVRGEYDYFRKKYPDGFEEISQALNNDWSEDFKLKLPDGSIVYEYLPPPSKRKEFYKLFLSGELKAELDKEINEIKNMPVVVEGKRRNGSPFVIGYIPGLCICLMYLRGRIQSKKFNSEEEWQEFKKEFKVFIRDYKILKEGTDEKYKW